MSDIKVWMRLGDNAPVEMDYTPLGVAAMMTKGYRQVPAPVEEKEPAAPAAPEKGDEHNGN